jgi:transcription elongation factor SPT4
MDTDGSGGMAQTPGTLKALRACKRCTLVKTTTQFTETGCDNCPFLRIEESSERMEDCTSLYFTGLIAMLDPAGSWVGKWQRIGRCKPGVYAVEVIGQFPPQDEEFMREEGIIWQCKPASNGNAE